MWLCRGRLDGTMILARKTPKVPSLVDHLAVHHLPVPPNVLVALATAMGGNARARRWIVATLGVDAAAPLLGVSCESSPEVSKESNPPERGAAAGDTGSATRGRGAAACVARALAPWLVHLTEWTSGHPF